MKAITFDFWDTLFIGAESMERDAARVDALAEAIGDRKLAEDAYGWAVDQFHKIHHEHGRTMGAGYLVGWIERTFPIQLSDHARDRLIKAWEDAVLAACREPVQGAAEAVREAASRYPIGLICDTGLSPGDVLRGMLRDAGLLECFTSLTFSGEVGVAKPRPEAFEHACAELGVAPSELLHIGDTEWTDVAGAHAVGAKAALFVGVRDRYLENTKADYVFRSWDEFVQWLRSQT